MSSDIVEWLRRKAKVRADLKFPPDTFREWEAAATIERLTKQRDFHLSAAVEATRREQEHKARAASLAAELAKAREALADVCNPLGKMRRDADAQGEVLSGMAYQIANSRAYVQGIAREALLSLPITGHSESGD